jgi:predicted transposase YbfD/YdcC
VALSLTPAIKREGQRVLIVRPITKDETDRWISLMRELHYLDYTRSAGERILYVAEENGEWVALLCWVAASLKLRCREEWIGWDNLAKNRRLKFVVNNSRFLLLKRVHNLASKVLALNCKRLSADWEVRWGHPVLLAETFVDPSLFRGTCYRAAGWIELGMTKGFKRTHTGYVEHGNKKTILVKPLTKEAIKSLADPMFESKKGKGKVFMVDVNRLPIEGKGGLIDVIRTVKDPRRRAGKRHSQHSVLAFAACAMLSGAKGYRAIWEYSKNLSPKYRIRLQGMRDYPVPSLSTFERVLQRIDGDEFDRKINAWLLGVAGGTMKRVAVDGKALRGSHDGEKRQVHLLSALVHDKKVTVAQKSIGSKTNEITEFRPLLAKLPLEGAVITADPMHCQVDHVQFLVEEKKADFIFTVKENQKNLLEWVVNVCDVKKVREEANLTRKGHGRLESHHLELFTPSEFDHQQQSRFPHIAQVFRLTRRSTNLTTMKETEEVRYAITSLSQQKANSQDLLLAQLGHWQIENSSHYVRDEVLGEDRSRVRKGSGPQVMATLRNLSIGVIRISGGESIAEAVREFSWSSKDKALRAIGAKV